VAFKVLRNQYASDEQFVERFKREARSAAALSHPNIVAIHDRGKTEDGAYYIVMEYVPGGTLEERMRREETITVGETVTLTLQVARALSYAHERGVIHRDIKPQNVLLSESGEAKVADFGIARAATSSTITRDGAILGTIHYVSPEQALGEPVDTRSDLYSLGVVLYEMLTGKVPYDAETPIGIAMKHVSGRLRLPIEVNSGVPKEINTVVARLLARDPEERYQDAAGLYKGPRAIAAGGTPGRAGRKLGGHARATSPQ
jgi:eukaryotic-like serine/threonine-protein kinase